MSGVENCLHFKSEEERQQWYSNAAKYWQVFLYHLTFLLTFVLAYGFRIALLYRFFPFFFVGAGKCSNRVISLVMINVALM